MNLMGWGSSPERAKPACIESFLTSPLPAERTRSSTMISPRILPYPGLVTLSASRQIPVSPLFSFLEKACLYVNGRMPNTSHGMMQCGHREAVYLQMSTGPQEGTPISFYTRTRTAEIQSKRENVGSDLHANSDVAYLRTDIWARVLFRNFSVLHLRRV
jgi:hypothetical protein